MAIMTAIAVTCQVDVSTWWQEGTIGAWDHEASLSRRSTAASSSCLSRLAPALDSLFAPLRNGQEWQGLGQTTCSVGIGR